MRRHIADWSAAAIAVLILGLGGLVVLKPAIDHWDDVYRADPFVAGTTTQKVQDRLRDSKRAKATRTTSTTTEDASSFPERLLGKSGTLLLRLGLVGLVAFLAGAVLQRALLGSYTMRVLPRASRRPDLSANPSPDPAPPTSAEPVAAPLRNGADTESEPPPPNLAPGIA